MQGLSFLCFCACAATSASGLATEKPTGFKVGLKRPYFWAGKNGDSMRTGASMYTVVNKLEGGPSWSWHEKDHSLVRAAPLIDDKWNIYMSTIPGKVHKFNSDGKELWMYNAHSEIPMVPAIMDGKLFGACANGQAFALDMETGKEIWKVQVADAIAGDTASITPGGRTVVVAAWMKASNYKRDRNSHILGLDTHTGIKKWSVQPEKPIYNFLSAIWEGSVVFSDISGRPYRVDLNDGHVIWVGAGEDDHYGEFTTGGAVVGPNGKVYVTSNKRGIGRIAAFDFKTGSELWKTDVGLEANNAAAVGYLQPSGGGPLAVVLGIGSNPDLPLSPTIQHYIGRKKRAELIALHAETGSPLWKYTLPSWRGSARGDTMSHICLPDAFSNPAIGGDGTVYIGFEDGKLYAVGDKNHDGVIEAGDVSTYDTKAAFQGSPAIAPGMLAAASCDGLHVYNSNN